MKTHRFIRAENMACESAQNRQTLRASRRAAGARLPGAIGKELGGAGRGGSWLGTRWGGAVPCWWAAHAPGGVAGLRRVGSASFLSSNDPAFFAEPHALRRLFLCVLCLAVLSFCFRLLLLLGCDFSHLLLHPHPLHLLFFSLASRFFVPVIVFNAPSSRVAVAWAPGCGLVVTERFALLPSPGVLESQFLY